MTKAFVRAKLPACDHYVITTFFYPPMRPKYEKDTTLVPPILRKTVLDAKKKARAGEHVLVYQTSTSDTTLVDELNASPARSSSSTACARTRSTATATLKEFSEDGFVEDLATRARGGVPTAGSRSSARRCSWASPSSASRCATSTSRCSTRATSRSWARGWAPSGSRPTCCACSCARCPSTPRASGGTGRTATVSSTTWSTGVLARFAQARQESAGRKPSARGLLLER